MDILKDRRVILAGGAGLALAAGLVLAVVLAGHHDDSAQAPPASQGGLVVQTGRDDDIKLDSRRPLRCFVNGQLVGELPITDCARRNGVASGALDVGLDASGALVASHGLTADVTPLPPSAATLAPAEPSAPTVVAPPGPPVPGSPCLRYAQGAWRRLPYDTSLEACVEALYVGQCVSPGGALYGRWGDRTLRLVPGRVEISADNRTFHTLTRLSSACFPLPSGRE